MIVNLCVQYPLCLINKIVTYVYARQDRVYMYICAVCVCMFMCLRVYGCMQVCMCVRMYVCVCMCVRVWVYVCVSVCDYRCIYLIG